MGAAQSLLRGGSGAMSQSNRNGVIGLGAALGFLAFVGKFNEVVQTYKAEHHIKKSAKIKKGLWQQMRSIFSRSCGPREALTIVGLATCLLLRTLGSVWVSQHWGRIVGA